MMKKQPTTKTTRLFAAALFAMMMMFAIRSSPATATPQLTTPCDALIATLRTDTVNATSLSDKNMGALLLKVDSAAVKLSQGKFCDALQKLNDYKSTLDALRAAAKPKVSEADYSLLSADAGSAIACVTGLVCNAGSTCGGTIACP